MTHETNDDTISTVVQLLYRQISQPDFAALADLVCDTLAAEPSGLAGPAPRSCRPAPGPRGTTPVGTVLHRDVPDGRVSLALHCGLGGAYATCITIAVSHRSRPEAEPERADSHDPLIRRLRSALTARHPADHVLMHVTPLPVTARLVSDLVARVPVNAPVLTGGDDPADLPRILRQVEAALCERSLRSGGGPRPAPRRSGLAGLWDYGRALTSGPSSAPAAQSRALQASAEAVVVYLAADNDRPDIPVSRLPLRLTRSDADDAPAQSATGPAAMIWMADGSGRSLTMTLAAAGSRNRASAPHLRLV